MLFMNCQMLLFKAFAIIDVVLRHKHWPFSDMMFIASSIPLFLFLSGFFYRATDEIYPLQFIIKKIKRLMVLYFIYNAVYASITWFIYFKSGIVLGQLPNLYNFFIQPFIDGQQYLLCSSLWFIPFFFMVQICYMFISKLIRKFSELEYTHFVIFAIIGLIGFGIRKFVLPDEDSLECIGLRLLVGVFFISFGRIFALKLDKKDIYQTRILLLMLGIRLVLFIDFNSPCYSFFKADFTHLSSICYSIIDIYFLLYIAKYLSNRISRDNILYKIGNNSYHIMANHMMVFFILDSTFKMVAGVTPDFSANRYIQHLWIAYLILAIIIPTYIGELSRIIKEFLIELVLKIKSRGMKVKELHEHP